VEDLAHGFSPDFWHKQSLGDNQVLSLSLDGPKRYPRCSAARWLPAIMTCPHAEGI
jgi:hypothetical protein